MLAAVPPPQYVFMARYLFKHRDNITFAFTDVYYMQRPSHFPQFDHPNNIWFMVQVMKLFMHSYVCFISTISVVWNKLF
jgi:hypothetical protein